MTLSPTPSNGGQINVISTTKDASNTVVAGPLLTCTSKTLADVLDPIIFNSIEVKTVDKGYAVIINGKDLTAAGFDWVIT